MFGVCVDYSCEDCFVSLAESVRGLVKFLYLKIEEVANNKAKVERMTEEGYDVVETPIPCLFTVVQEINTPRLPSLRGMMRAKSAKVLLWTQKELNLDPQKIGLSGSPTQVVKIFTPPSRIGGQILKGETPELAEQLVELLKNEIP